MTSDMLFMLMVKVTMLMREGERKWILSTTYN